MKTLQVDMPDGLARAVEKLVARGWFVDEAAVARQALVDFLRRNPLELQEQFQEEDVQWALSLKDQPS